VILIEHYVFKSSMFVLPFYNKRMYMATAIKHAVPDRVKP